MDAARVGGCRTGCEINSMNSGQTEQTLGDFIADLWRAKLYVFVGVCIALFCGIVFMMNAVPHKRATIILAPASPLQPNVSERDAVGDRSNHIPENADMFTRFMVSYKGAAVARLLLRDDEILAGLKADRTFKFSSGEKSWSAPMLADYISRRVVVDPIGETALRKLSYTHADGDFAALFLSRLHAVSDGLIRHAMRKDVNERITYLRKALSDVVNPDHRRNYTALLMEQERLKMLVYIDQPYAAAVVEPAFSSVRVFWPNTILVMIVSFVAGAFIGYAVYSFVQYNRRAETKPVLRKVNKVRSMREWLRPRHDNLNEAPITKPRTRTPKPFSASDAAE